MGSMRDLRARGDAVVGILNGVDYEELESGDAIVTCRIRYDGDDLSGKALQQGGAAGPAAHAGGVARTPAARHGHASRPAEGHRPATSTRCRSCSPQRDVRFVALGSGDAQYERSCAACSDRYPGRVVYHGGYSEELAHYHRGGGGHVPDAVALRAVRPQPDVQPALRHGARSCGAPAGSPTRVQHFDPATGAGTGVVFNDYDAGGLRWALATALEWYTLAERSGGGCA